MGSKSQQRQTKQQQNETTTVIIKDDVDAGSYANMSLNSFWPSVMHRIKCIKTVDAKNQQLPLARIKKIMKLDEDVKMISAEAPLLFAKAAEIFIHELTLMAWVFTEENKRRTLQRSDIAMAISKHDQFDFLIDIVPREEIRPPAKRDGASSGTESEAGGGSSSADAKGEDAELSLATTPAESSKPDSSAQIQYYLQLAQQQRQALTVQVAGGGGAEGGQQVATTTAPGAVSRLGSAGVQTVAVGGGSGLIPATPAAQQTTIPLTTLLASHQGAGGLANSHQQQQHILNPIQFQQPQATQQIITLSNGQQILVANPAVHQQQHHPQAILGGGQVIGSLGGATTAAVQQQPQFHILQQIMSPTGEVQHVQVRGAG